MAKTLQVRLDEGNTAEVLRRKGLGQKEATIVRSALSDHFALLRQSLPTFTIEEAIVIVEALKEFTVTKTKQASLIGDWVERQIEEGIPIQEDVVNSTVLIERLKGLSLTACLAVLDAVQQYWAKTPPGERHPRLPDTFVEVGLISAEQVEQRDKEEHQVQEEQRQQTLGENR
jgi:hypothetical protein